MIEVFRCVDGTVFVNTWVLIILSFAILGAAFIRRNGQ